MSRFLNLTFGLYALFFTLIAIGLAAVYSSSAAIVAYRENLARLKNPPAVSASSTAPAPSDVPGLDELFAPHDTPSYHSASILKKQAMWAFLGMIGLLIMAHIDYRFWQRWAPHLLAIAFILLLFVWMPGIGRRINYANRWIGLGPLTLQPSEIAKLTMVLFMARHLAKHQKEMHSFLRGFLPPLFVVGPVALVILKEPDLGATAVLCLIVFFMLFAAGAMKRHLTLLVMAAVPVVAVEFAVPYRRRRLLAFLNPEDHLQDAGWQLHQSLIAFGSGGVTGTGLGAGPQKYQFLSTAFSDFIYAIIGEETGLIGAIIVASLFLLLCTLGWLAAWRAPDMNGMLIAIGITCMFGLSAFIHMFVNVGLVPTKGLTLPFISAGGSSLFINMAAAGILINIARQGELYRAIPAREGRGTPSSMVSAVESSNEGRPKLIRVRSSGEWRLVPLDGSN